MFIGYWGTFKISNITASDDVTVIEDMGVLLMCLHSFFKQILFELMPWATSLTGARNKANR